MKKTGKDPAYLRFIRSLPCCVCAKLLHRDGGRQRSITEAAHAGVRGLSTKAHDKTAIPLCRLHHREGVTSLHQLGRKFWSHHDIDRNDVIAEYNAAYEKGLAKGAAA